MNITFKDTYLFVDARTLPVFSTAPSILFVDLDLEPGETKQCKLVKCIRSQKVNLCFVNRYI